MKPNLGGRPAKLRESRLTVPMTEFDPGVSVNAVGAALSSDRYTRNGFIIDDGFRWRGGEQRTHGHGE